MKKILLLATILCCAGLQQLLAHAMWVETTAVGKKGHAHQVRIYFGEYGDHDISPTNDWFSDIKNFTLVLIAPDKTEVPLTAKQDSNYYVANFTPTQVGVYTVQMHHLVKEVYSNLKLDYNSSATVRVENTAAGNKAEVNKNIISVFYDSAFAAKQGGLIKLTAYYNGKPASHQELEVFAPNGWMKKLYTNELGEAIFTPTWAGRYMAEIAIKENKPGEHNGVKYDNDWRCATYNFEVGM